MSETTPEYVDRAWALLVRGRAAAQRLWAGPDGPLAVALFLALGSIVEIAVYGAERDGAAIANLLATMPLALARRSLPWSAGLLAFGAVIALSDFSGHLTVSGAFALVVVCYLVASNYRRRWSVVLVLPFLGNAITPLDGGTGHDAGVLLLAVVVAAQAVGDTRREQGRAIAERDESRRAMADALSGQAAMEERARIARELHDVVAHHVSAIAVQAETARLTTADLPDEGKERLEAIGDSARGALAELRRLLGVMRAEGDDAERVPQPGLARLDDLIETAREAGTPVRLTLQGAVGPLPPGVDLCAYRIVQEALTNARRHAPGASVDVELAYEPDTLRLRIGDDGPGPDSAEVDGHGLLGMRERALMVGGSLRAGPGEKGGFAVEADLPTHAPGA